MPFSIRLLREADTAAVRSLWSERFGVRDAVATSWIDAVLDAGHPARGHVAVPSGAARPVVGFGLLDVAGPAYTRDYLGLGMLNVAFPPASRNGIFHMYCVQTAWEGRGVGTALFDRHLSVCRDANATRAVGIAWHRDRSPDSRPLFERFGFRHRALIERFYERVAPRTQCPDCGGACTCTASLFTRPIADAGSSSS